jgi:hypothetical protein
MTIPVTGPLSPEEIATVAAMVDRGEQIRAIAKALGCSCGRIQRYLVRHGLVEARARARISRKAELAATVAKYPDLSIRQLAKVLGAEPTMIRRIRNEMPVAATPEREKTDRFASPVSWLDEPPARIKAARRAEGIRL